jgi:hypothetical protein
MLLVFELLFGGVAIGILVGLSASPVVSAVITAVLSVVTVYATSSEKRVRLPAGPAVSLVIGVAIGSCLGLVARTHNWFGESPETIVARWKDKTGLDEKAIYRRLFEREYGSDVKPHVDDSVLFAAEASKAECDKLRPLVGDPLRNTLATVHDSRLANLAKTSLSPENLSIVVSTICAQ